jgi:hypothetical protein
MIAVALFTYVWHYLVARMIYDHLVRPLAHGDLAGIALAGCVAAVAFAAGRYTAVGSRRSARFGSRSRAIGPGRGRPR